MSYLKIVVATPVGTFEGFGHTESTDMETLIQSRDKLQEKIDSMETLTLFESTSDPQSKQITFPGTILKNSVVIFRII